MATKERLFWTGNLPNDPVPMWTYGDWTIRQTGPGAFMVVSPEDVRRHAESLEEAKMFVELSQGGLL